jgi:hypothetical protein
MCAIDIGNLLLVPINRGSLANRGIQRFWRIVINKMFLRCSKQDRFVGLVNTRWERIKQSAIGFSKASHNATGAVEILEQLPFCLWRATNGFGDDFVVL